MLSLAIGIIFSVLLFNVCHSFSFPNLTKLTKLTKLSKLNRIFFDLQYNIAKNIFKPHRGESLLTFHNTLSQKCEAVMVSPHYVTLTLFMFIFNILKPATKGFSDNISFLRIINTNECSYDDFYLIVGCDWCSLNNGMIETVKQNLLKNPTLIDQIDVSKLKCVNNFFSCVLYFREKRITDIDVFLWQQNNFLSDDPRLFSISKLYLQLEQVELRWCPFKRSKEYYYRNKDHRYTTPTIPNIYKIGKILSEHDTVTCELCPELVNNDNQFKNVEVSESIFVPFLNYLIEESEIE